MQLWLSRCVSYDANVLHSAPADWSCVTSDMLPLSEFMVLTISAADKILITQEYFCLIIFKDKFIGMFFVFIDKRNSLKLPGLSGLTMTFLVIKEIHGLSWSDVGFLSGTKLLSHYIAFYNLTSKICKKKSTENSHVLSWRVKKKRKVKAKTYFRLKRLSPVLVAVLSPVSPASKVFILVKLPGFLCSFTLWCTSTST